MSVNTSASQYNGTDPPTDHTSITGNTKTFHRFGELPREIQIKIFKHALPDPRTVYLRLEIILEEPREGIMWIHASVDKTRAPGLLPLLETCTTSNASVYSGDGFTKIKMEPLGSHPHIASKDNLNNEASLVYKDWGDQVLSYTYMRPSEDILVVDYISLCILYNHHGSLDLQRLTHIAVIHFGYLSVTTPWDSGRMTRLLNDIYSRCPCLKRLSVIASHDCPREIPPATRFLNIDRDLLKLDLRDKDERQVPFEEANARYEVLKDILKTRYIFDKHFESHREEVEEEGNKDVVEYWKKVERLTPMCAAMTMDPWQPYQRVRPIV
ncbi:hypothetical protein BOTCAL_0204g00130 [Botryotinia calthae]|uniref:2EXR domain-containing protein n=1 Tax=Botryotinia calthae TaxID=38488 RepID=A0A4Y8CZ42_9HELO|nr:hypothetical protein BOTCAL_0204g00130 [Botryotinia calthae]